MLKSVQEAIQPDKLMLKSIQKAVLFHILSNYWRISLCDGWQLVNSTNMSRLSQE